MVTARPSVETVWRWLDALPDPEIPAVSLTDLGIIRDVAWEGDTLSVTVTPTYSGCPATAVIALDIENALRDRGVAHVRLDRRLSPAWTTDWISERGRERLRAYGIAPPAAESAPCVGVLAQPQVDCPRCGSARTRRVSQFGSTPCKAAWVCDDCREPFDYFKRH